MLPLGMKLKAGPLHYVITCVQKGICVPSHHNVYTVDFFGDFLVYVYTSMANSNNLIDTKFIEFVYSTSNRIYLG